MMKLGLNKKQFMIVAMISLILIALLPALAGLLMGYTHLVYPWQILALLHYPECIFLAYATILLSIMLLTLFLLAQRGYLAYQGMRLLGLMLLILISVILGNFVFMLLNQPVKITGLPFYAPLVFIELPHYLAIRYLASIGICFLSMLLLLLISNKEKYNILGEARFATTPEIKKADLFAKEGIIIGKYLRAPLKVGGFEHVLGFAPTGSGKTSSIAITNLLSWKGSCIANDVKQTLWDETKSFREKTLGQKCYLWAPGSEDTCSYNPLDKIREDEIHLIADCQRISHILIPRNDKESPLWGQQARSLLVTLLIYLTQAKDESKTLSRVNELLKQESFDDWLQAMTENENYHPVFYQNAFTYLNQPEKTRGSTFTTLTGHFELYGDPSIKAATTQTDFNIDNLRKKPMTIYIGIPPSDTSRLSPLITLFWEQVIHTMMQSLPGDDEPYSLLCLLDEFSEMGRMEILRKGLKLLRQYRVRCVLLVQQLSQLAERYSSAESKTFTSIKTKVAFTPDELEDAEYLSKLLGNKTLKLKSGSRSSHERGSSTSRNYSYQAIPLMSSSKIMRMDKKQVLIIKAGHMPIKAKQFRWYEDKAFKNKNNQ